VNWFHAVTCEVLRVPVATGTLAGWTGEAAEHLEGFGAVVGSRLRSEPVIGADETSARVAGKGCWVHTASTPLLTWQTVHAKRGVEGIDAGGVLPGYQGVVVHDDWAPYRSYTDATHALCGAHLVRDLATVAETSGQGWAVGMRHLLVEAAEHTAAARAAGQTALEPGLVAGIQGCYTRLIELGLHANPAAGLPEAQRRRVKRPPPVNLLARLIAHRDEILRFVADLRVPFTNNQSERDLRMVKLQQKISGCWRTLAGASAFLIVRRYISTARKHGLSALAVLGQLFNGTAWLPQSSSR
jgi:transposase